MSELPYIEQLAVLVQTAQPFVAVTLVEAVGSTPQDTGTKMLVTNEGLAFGTVGGGRIEFKAIKRAQAMLGSSDIPSRELVEWNLQRDVGMTCGGLVKLFFEAYNKDRWHVVIFGAGHVAQALVRSLLLLDCDITCIDSRSDWLTKLPQHPRLSVLEVEDFAAQVETLQQTDYVICMTMGHNTDLPILKEMFQRKLEPAYLGVIGSRSKRKVLLRDLEQQGLPAEAVGPFFCPIGLPLGTNQPAEIAVSIVAQMLQIRGERQEDRSHRSSQASQEPTATNDLPASASFQQ